LTHATSRTKDKQKATFKASLMSFWPTRKRAWHAKHAAHKQTTTRKNNNNNNNNKIENDNKSNVIFWSMYLGKTVCGCPLNACTTFAVRTSFQFI